MNTSPADSLTPEQLQEMIEIVVEILGQTKACVWWKTPNPMLGEVSPAFMLATGRARKLYSFVKQAQQDNLSPPRPS